MKDQSRIQLRIEGLEKVNDLMKKASEQYSEMVQTLNLITEKAAAIEAGLNQSISNPEVENSDRY